MDGEFLGVKHVAVMLLHPCDSLEDHHDRAPFGADVDGLEGSIKD
jgi:hypothetical protein